MNSLEFIAILESLFPLKDGLLADNNGCNFYFEHKKVKCLIALDLTIDIINFAIKNDINFLILHHPVIFQTYNEEIKSPIKQKMFHLIEKNKITCYVIHTNYNISPIGINYKLLQLLNMQNIKLLDKKDVSYIGKLKNSKKFSEIIFDMNKLLDLNYHQYIGRMENIVQNVVICSGAGNSSTIFLDESVDLFITGELKWSAAVELSQRKINVLLLGHYMESFFIQDIYNILKDRLKNVEIISYEQKNILNVIKFSN